MIAEPTTPGDRRAFTYYYVLECPCGEVIAQDTEDELVFVALNHLRVQHPDRADLYEREHILFMARRLIKP